MPESVFIILLAVGLISITVLLERKP